MSLLNVPLLLYVVTVLDNLTPVGGHLNEKKKPTSEHRDALEINKSGLDLPQ
jgi:hypothetical protein